MGMSPNIERIGKDRASVSCRDYLPKALMKIQSLYLEQKAYMTLWGPRRRMSRKIALAWSNNPVWQP